MAKIKVKVKEGAFPIRFNGERFSVGEDFSIDDKYFNPSVMEKIEEKKTTSKTKTSAESE